MFNLLVHVIFRIGVYTTNWNYDLKSEQCCQKIVQIDVYDINQQIDLSGKRSNIDHHMYAIYKLIIVLTLHD